MFRILFPQATLTFKEKLHKKRRCWTGEHSVLLSLTEEMYRHVDLVRNVRSVFRQQQQQKSNLVVKHVISESHETCQ